ncbi:methionyl-tRNA synthetase [Mycoplasma testudineum]|uniref:Methionine--tRNA ligase n=1 Tax=Mycoplasma testudineum TaxID=244584 RepID=A0A4R6IE11_9MOLU|nr:methionine--tRNA ligase [Mycoplasma testudineum]OYD26698.1 methionine--tRNA ligase [Mycoplasma testudineum]TDO19828.1 methionyl-tRNA synthetase [Mycoplasma testudineum]
MNKKTYYITTPIYYPSGDLHLGHLFTTTQAWVMRNFKRSQGYDSIMVTGADEHGQKIYEKAIENKMEPQKYVDMQSQKFIDLWKLAQIDNDLFIRTSSEKHKLIIKKIFTSLFKKGFIYKGEYKGLYSISDEEFVTEANAKFENGKYYHPTSGHELTVLSEESYFFKLNTFYDWLVNEFLIDENVESKNVINELKANFLQTTVEDLSVTRIKIDWGIRIDEDPKHVIYVWLDALFNYITVLNYSEIDQSLYEKYWNNGTERVHIIGKEIARFHCIYWPIFLKSLDIKLPTKIVPHGWIITPTGKMSKSKNNVVDPVQLLKEFDPEEVKYFLVAKLNMFKDSVFSKELLINAINSDLANNFGNLISRTTKMIENNFDRPLLYKESESEVINDVYKKAEIYYENFKKFMNSYESDEAYSQIILIAKELNNLIDSTEPWKLDKNDPLLEQILIALMNGIYIMALAYKNVMPNKIAMLEKQWNNIEIAERLISDKNKFSFFKITKGNILFKRLTL